MGLSDIVASPPQVLLLFFILHVFESFFKYQSLHVPLNKFTKRSQAVEANNYALSINNVTQIGLEHHY